MNSWRRRLKQENIFFLLSKQCFALGRLHLKNPGLSTVPLRTQTLLLYSKHDFVSKLASSLDGHKMASRVLNGTEPCEKVIFQSSPQWLSLIPHCPDSQGKGLNYYDWSETFQDFCLNHIGREKYGDKLLRCFPRISTPGI